MMEQLSALTALNQVVVPDLWQQEAVTALRAGKDVVVQSPTGAGKTLIFELWSNQGKNREQAIYTVPTRALANDKLAEWRARGWNVGIATGDLSDNLDAPIIVATLETQKSRLIRGEGPALLVVDEYQMIGDGDRGLNYELALALAPARTQLLLLSGSVGNPQDVVKWLERLGRRATLVRYGTRPVPLEEVHAEQLHYHVPSEVKGYWPRLVAKCLAEDLGPLLIFAPRRQATEKLASELARMLPNPNPLALTTEQKNLVGDDLAKILKSRVAFHHSGLSYGARAGVVEPLAKAGQLRVVVATMGLAAGINFSLRSVALAADSYRKDEVEQPLRPDEILQMFGRAGRRGLDETGYVIVTANEIRMREASPAQLARSGMVDWSALLGLMSAAVERGADPFVEAVRVQERLFTTKPIVLGVEFCIKHPQVACGLRTDAERARHIRGRYKEILNSAGEWERAGGAVEVELEKIQIGPQKAGEKMRSILTEQAALEKIGTGQFCILGDGPEGKIYGRGMTVAEILNGDRVLVTKWIRRLIQWTGREATREIWNSRILPLVEKKLAEQKMPVLRVQEHGHRIVAQTSLGKQTMRVAVDSHGVALWRPNTREVMPYECAGCPHAAMCQELPTTSGTALTWKRLGLVDADGKPTLRGKMVSFFQQGDGLAIAVALEDVTYDLKDLIYDLANLDAGFRFCGEENRWGGRMAVLCSQAFGLLSIPGYLENGMPPKYGSGAETVVAAVHKNPAVKYKFVKEFTGLGDIDRVIIEWRSILRQVSHAPALPEWVRWTELQQLAKEYLAETESPTLVDLPPLDYHQTRRIEHRLVFRRG